MIHPLYAALTDSSLDIQSDVAFLTTHDVREREIIDRARRRAVQINKLLRLLYDDLTELWEIDEPENAHHARIGENERERCQRMTNAQQIAVR